MITEDYFSLLCQCEHNSEWKIVPYSFRGHLSFFKSFTIFIFLIYIRCECQVSQKVLTKSIRNFGGLVIRNFNTNSG